MATYPTGFSERPQFIDHTNYDDRKGFLRKLQESGYRVQLGMTQKAGSKKDACRSC